MNSKALARARFVLGCFVLSACGDRRAVEAREQLARFPDGVIFDDLENPSSRTARELPNCLRFLAPVIGRGVCVPLQVVRPDGGRGAPKWGRWTYEYVRTTQTTSPDGVLRTNFTDIEGSSLGIEARGKYENNVVVGAWTFWHPNGNERAVGSFTQGRMSGKWRFWLADGSPDTTLSGVYEADARVSALPR